MKKTFFTILGVISLVGTLNAQNNIIGITPAGEIGLGTYTPNAHFTIEKFRPELSLMSVNTASDSWNARIVMDRRNDYRGAGLWITASQEPNTDDWYIGAPYTGNGISIGKHGSQPHYVANSLLFVHENGNVGVGTASPSTSLHVNGNAEMMRLESSTHNYISFYRLGNAGGRSGYIGFANPANNNFTLYNDKADGYIQLMSKANTSILLNPSSSQGNVGIGTYTPDASFKLDVQGDVRFRDNVGVGTASPSTSFHVKGNAEMMRLESSTHNYISFYRLGNGDGRSGYIGFANPANNNFTLYNDKTDGDIQLMSKTNTSILLNPAQSSQGNVGIGTYTPDPSFKLDVQGDVRFRNNVGVGTALPSCEFHINGNDEVMRLEGSTHSYMTFYPDGNAAGRKGYMGFSSAGTHSITILNDYADGDINLHSGTNTGTNGSVNLNPSSTSGNVGIGTYAPAAAVKFDVSGDTRFRNTVGIGRLPDNSVQALIDANSGRVGLCVVTYNDPGGYGIKAIASNAGHKAIAVNTAESNGNDVFRVMGDGHVYATEIDVRLQQNFPDYVFEDNYELLPLKELEAYIDRNGRLPNMPSAEEVEKKGLDLGGMQVRQMEKIEELTLYILQLEERIRHLEASQK